jgi:8-oxo-dGTP diphosphatase
VARRPRRGEAVTSWQGTGVEAEWTRVGAYALCLDEDRILLTRFFSPGHPDHGRWTLPGGRMEWGESARDAAHRELFEETGLEATLGAITGVFSRWYTATESARGIAGHMVGIVFHATMVDGRLRTVFDHDDTTDAAAWFRLDELDDLPRVELVDFVLQLLSGTARDASG